MLKKTITYENFDNEIVTEEFYFHLTKADVIKMEASKKGGLQEYISRAAAAEDTMEVLDVFEDLIRRSYRQRVEGKFHKSAELSQEFLDSEAYSELLIELISRPDKAAEFIAGVKPKGLEEAAEKIATAAIQGDTAPVTRAQEREAQLLANQEAMRAKGVEPSVAHVPTPENPRILTAQEVVEMDGEELRSGLATGRYRLS